MYMKYLFCAVLFIFSLTIGYGFFIQVFDYDKQTRSVASLNNHYDLTCLSGDEFLKAVKKRIISGFKTTRKNGYLGMHLGHFTFSDPSEEKDKSCGSKKERTISSALQVKTKKLACREYPKLSLQFAADQEANSGEKRELLVEADCSVSTDLSHTDMVWIPWDQLAQETPFEGDTQYNTPSKVLIKTTHISDAWPKKWILEKIELKGATGFIKVSAEDIRNIAGRPMVFEFK